MNFTTIGAAVAAVALAAPASSFAADRVSVSSDGRQGDAHSGYALPGRVAVSGDGRFVAFPSDATNLVAGDTNGASDIFVRDRETGTTTRVSPDTYGALEPAISADGRVVAYAASVGRLSGGYDRGTGLDVFVHDRETGKTVRVSRRFAGAPRDRRVLSDDVALSGNGRYVAYKARRMTHGDAVPLGLFVYDRRTGATTRIGRAGWDVSTPSLSRDGTRVSFFTRGDDRTRAGMYVFDRRSGRMLRVLATRSPGEPSISADGRFVVYEQARRGVYRLSVRDLRTGKVRSAGRGVGATISRHGERIAFQTTTDGLIGDATGPLGDVVVRDVRTGAQRMVSALADGEPSGHSGMPALSIDGRTVAFASSAPLDPADTNGVADVFTAAAR